MFKDLKRKFIITNLLTSTLVLLFAFSIIYLIASASANDRPPIARESITIENGNQGAIQTLLEERLHDDRRASLNTLLITLIIVGLSIETVIAIFSVYLAEKSIQPVRQAYEIQKDFIANASHEIKTPLAVIQANLEAADIKGNHWIDNVELKVQDLAALNQQLLTLARAESTSPSAPSDLEPVDLVALVHQTAAPYAPKVKEKRAALTISPPLDPASSPNDSAKSTKSPSPSAKPAAKSAKPQSQSATKSQTITLNRPALSQLLNILIDNAIKYCDKKILITVADKSITIKNDGAIIKKSQLPHIFDRFYQTDKTKTGLGLGLAIAKSLADHESWQLTASSTAKYTIFKIQL